MRLSGNPFRRPFPDRNLDRTLILGHARVGIFIFLFLYIFRPVGVAPSHNFFWVCLGYGLVTFVVSFLYALVTLELLGWEKSGKNWTLGKWVLDCALLLACIAVGNFIYYNALIGWTAFVPEALLAIAVPTVLIGLFPIAFSGMAIQLRAEREHQMTAARITGQQSSAVRTGAEPSVLLPGDLTLSPSAILLCEARQNYVRVVHADATDTVVEVEIRATLSAVAEQLRHTDVLRCHRSFLVNVNRVVAATGNAQGLRLSLSGYGETVPVSRSFVPELRAALAVRP